MAKKYTSSFEVLKRLNEMIIDHAQGIPGADLERLKDAGAQLGKSRRDSISLTLRRGWGLECNLYVGFQFSGRVTDEDGKTYLTSTVQVELGWSSTGRSPSAARAAIALYSELTDLACLLEAVGSEYRIGDLI